MDVEIQRALLWLLAQRPQAMTWSQLRQSWLQLFRLQLMVMGRTQVAAILLPALALKVSVVFVTAPSP